MRDWIDAHDEEPGWKHVAKIARPVWHLLLSPAAKVADLAARFTADRVTPGNLGLELTTLLALGADRRVQLLPDRRRDPQQPAPAHRPLGAPTSPTGCTTTRSWTSRAWSPTSAPRRSPRADARHGDLRRRQTALDRRRRARRRLAAGLRRGPRRQGRLRPRAPAERPHRHVQRGLSLRPHRLRRLADRVATVLVRAGVGWAARIARGDGRRDPRRGRRRHPHLPARALPHRRARRSRAGGRDLVARGHRSRLFAGRVRHNVGSETTYERRREDLHHHRRRRARESRVAWLAARGHPRLEVATGACATGSSRRVLSVYILAAFVLAGTGVGLAALWYFSDRVEL